MQSAESKQPEIRGVHAWLTPRRLRTWREHLTGYLMVAPALILIFIFGIFPVGFALFVSLHKWRLKRGDIIGLDNFTSAIGNLAYLLIFAVAVGALVWAFLHFSKTRKKFSRNTPAFLVVECTGCPAGGGNPGIRPLDSGAPAADPGYG